MNATSKKSMKTISAGLVVLAIFSALPAYSVCTTTISSTADSGAGSLRAAIAAASSGDTICVTATGTITLTSGELLINQNLTITGPGAASLAIDGNAATRVFEIVSGNTVTISDLTIQNGSEPSTQGGGIKNNGTLTLSNSTVAGNAALGAGGIFNNTTGTMHIVNSTISGNHSNLAGGGGSAGGGIWNFLTMTITGSTISGNTAGGSAGGILSESQNGTMTPSVTLDITNSTISGNTARTFSAGGIQNLVATLTVSNSTVAGNAALGLPDAQNPGGTGGNGGGIWNLAGPATVKNSILAGNTSLQAGAGNCAQFVTALTSQGYNLSDDTSCTLNGFSQATDINNMPAGLDPTGLQSNGGPTKTIKLLSGLAIDAIPLTPTNFCKDVAGNPVTTDQRGTTRPQGTKCDIGAFEFVTPVAPTITFGTAPAPTFPGPNFTVSATTNSDGALTFSVMSGPCAFVSETATAGTFSSSGTGTCVVKASAAATLNFLAGSNTQSVIISGTATSPAQMVANLITTLQGMNITGQGTSLSDQLNQIASDITANNGLACNDLLLFINHVKAQKGKKITVAQANILLVGAASIQAALSCGP